MGDKAKFFILDFADGSQIVPYNWLRDGRKKCLWPPWAQTSSQLFYDKRVQSFTSPTKDWILFDVERIRAFGDDFEKVRAKLKEVDRATATDLNSGSEGGKRKKRRKTRTKSYKRLLDYETESDNENRLPGVPKLEIPAPSVKTLPLTPRNHVISAEPKSVGLFDNPNSPPTSNHLSGGSQAQDTCRTTSPPKRPDNKVSAKLKSVGLFHNQPKSSRDKKVDSSFDENFKKLKQRKSTSTPIKDLTVSSSSVQVGPSSLHLHNPPTSPHPNCSVPKFGSAVNKQLPNTPASPPCLKSKALELADSMGEREFRAYVISGLSYLRSRAFEQKAIRPAVEGDDDDDDEVLRGLPTLSKNVFLKFDKHLDNKAYAADVKKQLSRLSDNDLGAYVRKVLSRVMLDDLAKEYSFCGAKGKDVFKNLNFNRLLFKVIRLSKKFSHTPDKPIVTEISNWLRLAKQRSEAKASTAAKRASNYSEDYSESKRKRRMTSTSQLNEDEDDVLPLGSSISSYDDSSREYSNSIDEASGSERGEY